MGVVYATPEARWKLFQEGLSLQGVQAPPCQKGVYPERQRETKTLGHTDVSCILHLLSKFVGNRSC